MTMRRLWILSTFSLLIIGATGCAVSAKTTASPANLVAQNSSQDLAQNSSQQQPREPQPGERHRRIDFAAAAEELGTTETALKEALGVPAQPEGSERRPHDRPRPNLQEAATQLGVTEEQLTQAFGITIDPQTGEPSRPRTRPNFQAVAAQLGVTEDQLKQALGMPDQSGNGDRNGAGRPEGRRSPLDITGAATKLGVTEDQLVRALGIRLVQRLNRLRGNLQISLQTRFWLGRVCPAIC
ncbi:MAG: hypothetical protein HC772_07505 [Leptolyngbyaceae cyanobacterium CRU_2_3]|nr:hypothetical protein [Leptolyngbyaceae cyanobacterium CRU_2_3]